MERSFDRTNHPGWSKVNLNVAAEIPFKAVLDKAPVKAAPLGRRDRRSAIRDQRICSSRAGSVPAAAAHVILTPPWRKARQISVRQLLAAYPKDPW